MKYVAINKVDNNILLRGDGCVTTMRELFNVLVDNSTTEIELRRDFIETNFTYDALCDFVSQASVVNPNVRLWASGVIYDNMLEGVKELLSFREAYEFTYAVEHDSSKIISVIHELCRSYITAHVDANIANNKIATMLVTIDDLQKEIEELEKRNRNVITAYNDATAKLSSLVSRVNFKYEKTVNPDELFLMSENKYSHILYVKEITRVHYTDTLLYYVRQIINTLYGMPVRYVVIEPFYSYGCEQRYPDLKPHWNLTYRDVQSGDILMAGFQPKLMGDILQNANHVSFLIILDRGGYMVPHVQNGNVSTVYTVSDTKDIPSNIGHTQVISYSPQTMYIPFIPDFGNLSPEERITKYSSMPVTQHLINLLEEVK